MPKKRRNRAKDTEGLDKGKEQPPAQRWHSLDYKIFSAIEGSGIGLTIGPCPFEIGSVWIRFVEPKESGEKSYDCHLSAKLVELAIPTLQRAAADARALQANAEQDEAAERPEE